MVKATADHVADIHSAVRSDHRRLGEPEPSEPPHDAPLSLRATAGVDRHDIDECVASHHVQGVVAVHGRIAVGRDELDLTPSWSRPRAAWMNGARPSASKAPGVTDSWRSGMVRP